MQTKKVYLIIFLQILDEMSDELSRGRRRKMRTVFTDDQLLGLEESFIDKKYLTVPDRLALANKLGLTEIQVRTAS